MRPCSERRRERIAGARRTELQHELVRRERAEPFETVIPARSTAKRPTPREPSSRRFGELAIDTERIALHGRDASAISPNGFSPGKTGGTQCGAPRTSFARRPNASAPSIAPLGAPPETHAPAAHRSPRSSKKVSESEGAAELERRQHDEIEPAGDARHRAERAVLVASAIVIDEARSQRAVAELELEVRIERAVFVEIDATDGAGREQRAFERSRSMPCSSHGRTRPRPRMRSTGTLGEVPRAPLRTRERALGNVRHRVRPGTWEKTRRPR